MYCSCRCSGNCYKTLTFCSLLARFKFLCACHAKRFLNVQKWSVPTSFLHFWLGNVLRATTAFTFSTSQLPRVRWLWCAFYILTWTCASRHNGAHFFHIWTSKSDPSMWCVLTFLLGNVLRATTACIFSTSQLLKALRMWGVFSFFISKCASRNNGVQFFISPLARWRSPSALARLLFDPLEPQITWKKFSESRLYYLFAHLPLFLLCLSLLWSSHFVSSPLWLFPPLLFQLSILSEVSLLTLQWNKHYVRLHI